MEEAPSTATEIDKGGIATNLKEAVQIACDTDISTTVNQTTRSCR
jgi:hypothetical protein